MKPARENPVRLNAAEGHGFCPCCGQAKDSQTKLAEMEKRIDGMDQRLRRHDLMTMRFK